MANTSNEETKQSLTKFVDVFKKLNSTIDKYNRFQPWLVFKLINQYEGGNDITVLTIDTFTAVGTVNLPGVGTQRISNIMLTNFEYNKNGAGKANTFTLSFAFNPEDKPEAGGTVTAPGLIDKALTISSYYSYDDSTNSNRAINSMNKHKCYMRYGYNFGDTDLQSPEYYGQALKANSELRDGLIYYTITGYSSLTYMVDLKVSFSSIGDKDGNTNGTKASKAMAAVLFAAFGGGDNFSITGEAVSIDGGEYITADNINKLRETTSKLYPGIKITIINELTDSDENDIYIPESNNESIFSYLDKIASSASLTCNTSREDAQKAFLTYTIDEKDKELIFRIFIDDPTLEAENYQATDLTADIVYKYPDKGNNIVKSFTPDFRFETIWSQDIFSDEDYNKYDLASDGTITKSTEYNNTEEQTPGVESIAKYSEALQYSYTADLTTIGIPADIPIGTIIKVAPIINGQEYHYSGKYLIKKTIDRIDTMGYTTEYSLMKLDPKREKKNSDENQEEKQFIGPVQAPEIQNATKNSGGGSSGNGSGGSGGGAW